MRENDRLRNVGGNRRGNANIILLKEPIHGHPHILTTCILLIFTATQVCTKRQQAKEGQIDWGVGVGGI